MIKYLYAALLALTLTVSSCSALDWIKPSQGIAVDTEIVAGDKEIVTEVVNKKTTNTNTAESLVQTYNTVNKEYPFWVVALLVLGWVLPSPRQMMMRVVNIFRGKK